MNIFLNAEKQLKNIWWVAIFFLVLAALTFPVIIISQTYRWEITITHQAIIVVAATWICQLLRKQPLSQILGSFNLTWIRNFLTGLLLGAALMLLPALLLTIGGFVHWQMGAADILTFASATGMFAAVAIAEEVLFRGFIFQRLMAAVGEWGAQFLLAAYFLLIHMNNPGMTGTIKMLASANILIASLMFGIAFIRTGSLAMPLALHFMANWMQGTFLGFGVSGNEQASLFKPVFDMAPQWLTGGSFGLEASVPGLGAVIATIVLLYRWKPQKQGVSITEEKIQIESPIKGLK